MDMHDVAFSENAEQKTEKKRLKPGDIIIEKSGGSKNQPVGRVVYFDIDDGKKYPPDELHIVFKVLRVQIPDVIVPGTHDVLQGVLKRSEERRVGKEWRWVW